MCVERNVYVREIRFYFVYYSHYYLETPLFCTTTGIDLWLKPS